MYPLAASTLSLPELAKHWQRSIAEQPLAVELETLLLQAFWRGSLVMTLPSVPEARHLDPRVRLLDLCRHVSQDAGLIVADRPEDLPAETTVAQEDGSVGVDLRRRVVWPSEAALQSSALLAEACVVLSQAAWGDYHELVEPVLGLLEIDQEAFGAFCAAEGFPLPLFWFRADRRPPTAKARGNAQQWLIKEVAASAKQHGKLEYWQKARVLFPQLSLRAFNEIWAKTVPPNWRKAGTLRKPS